MTGKAYLSCRRIQRLTPQTGAGEAPLFALVDWLKHRTLSIFETCSKLQERVVSHSMHLLPSVLEMFATISRNQEIAIVKSPIFVFQPFLLLQADPTPKIVLNRDMTIQRVLRRWCGTKN